MSDVGLISLKKRPCVIMFSRLILTEMLLKGYQSLMTERFGLSNARLFGLKPNWRRTNERGTNKTPEKKNGLFVR